MSLLLPLFVHKSWASQSSCLGWRANWLFRWKRNKNKSSNGNGARERERLARSLFTSFMLYTKQYKCTSNDGPAPQAFKALGCRLLARMYRIGQVRRQTGALEREYNLVLRIRRESFCTKDQIAFQYRRFAWTWFRANTRVGPISPFASPPAAACESPSL